MNNEYQIDKNWIKNSFDQAAASYDEAAVLQREVADRVLERFELIKMQPSVILDIGSGTGYSSQGLKQKYKKARIISLDIAPGMLRYARGKLSFMERLKKQQSFLCADAESLPLADDSVDLVYSSLAIQWCNDLDKAFAEFYRVLRPGGLLMFSTLGPDTLKELRASWRAVDGDVHVSGFIDMHDVGDALIRNRYGDPVMDMENIVLTYDKVSGLMKDLKKLGSRNAAQGRSHHLTGKQRLLAMQQAYERFRKDGVLPATYEVVYGHAWIPEKKFNPVNQSGNDFPIPVKVVPR